MTSHSGIDEDPLVELIAANGAAFSFGVLIGLLVVIGAAMTAAWRARLAWRAWRRHRRGDRVAIEIETGTETETEAPPDS